MECENGVVIWDVNTDPEAFKERNPDFAEVPNAQITAAFQRATLFLNNSPCSIVPCAERIPLYDLLMAWTLTDQGRGATLVGQVASASQGSVSLGLSPVSADSDGALYMTNDYGKNFWLATAKYRTLFYVPYRACPKTGPYKCFY